MAKYNDGQLTLTDRVAIEIGIARRESFKQIAKTIGRSPVTVSREIKNNRTYMPPTYPYANDCKNYHYCHKKQLCGAESYACNKECKTCIGNRCKNNCSEYESAECLLTDKPPYVCNLCKAKNRCHRTRYIYNAKFAEAACNRRRSESRKGVQLSDEQLKEIDSILKPLVKKGQPLTHIYAEHENEFPVSLRSLYTYVDSGVLSIRNIDLRRKTGYRRRRRKDGTKPTNKVGNFGQSYREGRSYEEYEEALKTRFAEFEVVEIDTVKGVRETGKRLLTMLFRRNSIMLLFLMPDGKAESVIRVFDYLEAGLGYERFCRLFPVILTDNGSEFKKVDRLEMNEDYCFRTNVYYCDPMASWQKGALEKNHEYIRYAIPKGKTLNPYSQEDMTLLMNHINSTKRKRLNGKAPYELVEKDDEDMIFLMELLKMHLIPADEVHLKPDLFR